MKRILFILPARLNAKLLAGLFLEIVFCNLLFATPIHAFSLWDIFPPLKMINNPKYGNPPATVVKEIGPQGVSKSTYINQLESATICHSKVTVSNSWAAQEEDIYDKNGKKIGREVKYPYDARDLSAEKVWTKMSNSYTRLIGAQYSNRGITTLDNQEAADNFKDLSLAGQGYLPKIYSVTQKQFLQSQMFEEVFKAIDGRDTNYGDIQRGWDCGGAFLKMDDKNHSKSCRPVTVGEIAYFYYLNQANPDLTPILYTDPVTMTPKPLPPNLANYPKTYKKTHKKSINLLSASVYQILAQDLPIKALGPSNQMVIPTNYNSVASQWPNFQPADGTQLRKKRLIPNGLAGNPLLSNQLSSVTSPHDFATPFDCNEVEITGNNPQVVDKPGVVKFIAYVRGLIRGGINDEPTWAFSHDNPLKTETETTSVDAATNVTNDLANIIPAGQFLDSLKAKPAASKIDSEHPIDPGYQATEIFQAVRSYLHPQSWQDNYF